MDATERQRRVSYHESGHAVVANVLGLGVSSVERNEDGSGECRIPFPGPVLDEASVYAAGSLAEWIKFGTKTQLSPNDLRGVRRVSKEYQAKAVDRAEQILRDHWSDVEALAIRLLEDPDGFVPIPFAPDYSKSDAS